MTPQDPPVPPHEPSPDSLEWPEPPKPEPRRVVRSTGDRWIAGVAAGLARHFALDPALVRIGFVVLLLFGGSGIVLYAILWALLPSDDSPALISTDSSGTRKALLITLIVAACVTLPFTGSHGIFVAGPALAFLAVVGALGVLLWRAAGGEGDRSLTRAALLVLAIFGSLLLGLGAGIAAAFGGGEIVAGVVIVAGGAMVVGGFLGGARWLVVPALLIAIPASLVAASDIDLTGGVGQRDYRPASLVDLDPSYRLGAGELRLDLRDVDLPSGRTDLDLSVGVGHVDLTVPEDVCVQVRSHVGAGEVDAFGRTNDGIDVNVDRRPSPRADAPVLFVDAEAGLGRIEIDHAGLADHQTACLA